MSPDRAEGDAARASGAPARGLYSWIRRRKSGVSRISAKSTLYTRVLPILILALGVLTAALILFAAGVLLGLVPFR
jgi:hypothetical protein